jgi:dihydroxyacetone kinase
MAGVSLTLAWLDDELEQLWAAPAYTPAFRKGAVDASVTEALEVTEAGAEKSLREPQGPVFEPGTPESQAVASRIVGALAAVASALDEHAEELGRIDAVAGDGDHGIGMQRGSAAAASAVAELSQAGAGTTLRVAANAWSDRGGGTSGALWGIALRALGDAFGDEVAPDGATIAAGLAAARDGIVQFGKAEVGDKTMLDVLVPIVEAAQSLATDGSGRWSELVGVAEGAAAATSELLPKIGRARPHAEKSLGTPDAGAVSLALIVKTVVKELGV